MNTFNTLILYRIKFKKLSSYTWIWTYCCNAPLVDVGSVSLYFLISAALSVPIMTSCHVDSVLHYACSSIPNTYKRSTKNSDPYIILNAGTSNNLLQICLQFIYSTPCMSEPSTSLNHVIAASNYRPSL